ncbi:MAG: MiaB/RimO family radical SAM methylthiotransferase [Terriglobales bacterium]
MGASFYVHNFGCRANQADGAALAAACEQAGLRAAEESEADWVVFNTCTVTAAADAEVRRAIRRLHRLRPQAQIAVTGCYAERAGAEIAGLGGVTLVAGHRGKAALPQQLLGVQPQPQKLAALAQLEFRREGSGERSRPVVKVQEGCGRACSFCIIPQVRGASRSRPLGEVLGTIDTLVAAGHAEIVCSGINLGQWGRDLDGNLRLADLARSILEQTALPRLRLSSVEPRDWTPELTALMAASGGRLARHAHLPLQSGSDAVLQRMHRRYRAQDYAALVEELAAQVPGVAIGADVMAGFPGESGAEFAEGLALIEKLPLAYLHVFPFSLRPGTEAARRLEAGAWRAVPAAVTMARVARLRQLGAAKRIAFLDALVGRTLSAVALHGGEAISDNYARITLATPAAPGTLVAVPIRERNGEMLTAL